MEHTSDPNELAFTTPTSSVEVIFGYKSAPDGPLTPCKVTIEFPTGTGYSATRAALSVLSMRDGARNIIGQLSAMQDAETIARANKFEFDRMMKAEGFDV